MRLFDTKDYGDNGISTLTPEETVTHDWFFNPKSIKAIWRSGKTIEVVWAEDYDEGTFQWQCETEAEAKTHIMNLKVDIEKASGKVGIENEI